MENEDMVPKANYTSPQKRPFSFLKLLFYIFLSLAALLVIVGEIRYQLNDAGYYDTYKSKSSGFVGNCNVQGIQLLGDVVTFTIYGEDGKIDMRHTSADQVLWAIEQAENDDNIKAIMLEVDSYGGWPVAAEEIALALESATKPTVAQIRGAGVSAAYWAASGADMIIASANSDVGSIGVTASYLDSVEKNKIEGFTFNELHSGAYKDFANPNKSLTDDEKALIERDLEIIHSNFIEAVAKNRNLSTKKVAAIADGSTMLGEQALENGLIDKIGGQSVVAAQLEEEIGETVSVCW